MSAQPSHNNLLEALRHNGIPVRCDVSLRDTSYFRSGGNAKVVVEPDNVQQLVRAVEIFRERGTTYKVIGETTNLIFHDDADYTVLLSTVRMKGLRHDPARRCLIAEAGVSLPDLSRFALQHKVTGFAGLEGIPGTIGGAVFMNAAAYGYSISDTLEEIRLLEPSGHVTTVKANELELGYRTSVFRENKRSGIVLEAVFRAEQGDPSVIYAQMELFHAKRHKYLEYMHPNVGSVFAGSIYRELARKDPWYRLIAAAYMFFNYKFKIFRRESPINRKWINDFTVRRFGIQFERQPFSDKTMNTLINNGHHTRDHLDYIRQIQELTDGRVPLENEFVDPF
jgi:UDP-N-acetylmuramate dehydrogenase